MGRALGHAFLGRNAQAELAIGIRVGSRSLGPRKGQVPFMDAATCDISRELAGRFHMQRFCPKCLYNFISKIIGVSRSVSGENQMRVLDAVDTSKRRHFQGL